MRSEYESMSNSELEAGCKNGDKDAHGVLLQRYHPRMLELAIGKLDGNKYEAEAAVQNAVLKILEYKEIIENFWAFTAKTVINECFNIIRQRIKDENFLKGLATEDSDVIENDDVQSIDIQETAAELNKLCDDIIDNAGFLHDTAADLFREAMKGQCDIKTIEKRFREESDHIIGLDIEKCLDFLKREAEYSYSTSGNPNRLREYRKEIERIILGKMPNANRRFVSLLVDAHMVTSAWPGWPFAKWSDIDGSSEPPKRFSKLVESLKKYGSPEKLKLMLKFIHFESLKLRRQRQWPF